MSYILAQTPSDNFQVHIEAACQQVHALVLVLAVALEGDGGGGAGYPSTGKSTSIKLMIDAEVPKSE